MNGVIDYWCNIFTPEGIRASFTEQPELAEVLSSERPDEGGDVLASTS